MCGADSHFVAIAYDPDAAKLRMTPLAPRLASQLALPVDWQASLHCGDRIALSQELQVVSRKSVSFADPRAEALRIIENRLESKVHANGIQLPNWPFCLSRGAHCPPLVNTQIVVQFAAGALAASADLQAHAAVCRAQSRAFGWQHGVRSLLEAAHGLQPQAGMSLPAEISADPQQTGAEPSPGVLHLLAEQGEDRFLAEWRTVDGQPRPSAGDMLRRTVRWTQIGFLQERSATADVAVVVE